jgi:mRNA interferase RelE/StbE
MGYQVSLRPSAERQRRQLDNQIRQRINEVLLVLEESPRPSSVMKLRGRTNQWRIRVGDYRIVYEIDDERRLVTILAIKHRREAYR